MADGEQAATCVHDRVGSLTGGPQRALLACPVFEVFFGGARGGGKADEMLSEWASHADLLQKERCRIDGPSRPGATPRDDRAKPATLCADRGEIKRSGQDVAPNGARLRFAYLDRDADADAYQGHSYTRVYVEEVGTFPSASPVLATLRSGEGVPSLKHFRAARG
jgi:hypothetical protein